MGVGFRGCDGVFCFLDGAERAGVPDDDGIQYDDRECIQCDCGDCGQFDDCTGFGGQFGLHHAGGEARQPQ